MAMDILFSYLVVIMYHPGLEKGEGDLQPEGTQCEAEATSACPGGRLRHQEQHHQVKMPEKRKHIYRDIAWVPSGYLTDLT